MNTIHTVGVTASANTWHEQLVIDNRFIKLVEVPVPWYAAF